MTDHDTRLRFLQRLRQTPTYEVRRLLQLETVEERKALLDACFPDGDEAMRSIIEQELPNAPAHLPPASGGKVPPVVGISDGGTR